MEYKSKSAEFLTNVRPHIRAKPGMYFGCGGSAAVPRMLNEFIIAVLQDADCRRRIALEIEINEAGPTQIQLRFTGGVCRSLLATKPMHWLEHRSPLTNHLTFLVAAMDAATVVVSDGGKVGELRATSQRIRFGWRGRKAPAGLTISGRLYEPTFGRLSAADFHRLGGMLRDLSILRPGLAASLKMGKSTMQLAWRYPDGLKTFLAEMDHSRWPLHPDYLHFSGEQKDMKVEGCVRFVHAGMPEVRSWVNFHPSHGGAHYEGFGDTLKKVFPDAKAGCRRVRFVTNPDTNARVMLPHPFVAAIHVQLSDPKFAGPTKDILLGEDVRAFVREAANAALPQQWEELRDRRI